MCSFGGIFFFAEIRFVRFYRRTVVVVIVAVLVVKLLFTMKSTAAATDFPVLYIEQCSKSAQYNLQTVFPPRPTSYPFCLRGE